MTVYIFDKGRRVRDVLGPGDAVDLIHDENNHKITISIKSSFSIMNGEYIGFRCVDENFRIFCVTNAAMDDDKRLTDVTATDAIVQDMKETIIEGKQMLDAGLMEALEGYIPDDSWVISGEEPSERKEKSRAYYTSLRTMVTTLEQLYEWKIDAHYIFEGGQITGKMLYMRSPAPVFRGRIFQSGRDASKVLIANDGRPITRLYGLGKSTGTEEEPKNLTFADVVWSKDNGDPVDKPRGQTWVEDPEAAASEGVHTDVYTAQDAETEDDLLERTWEELQRRKKPVVSIKATVADMEMVSGYSHMQIRLGDLVAVCLKSGDIIEAKIIAIKRHYFRPWMTTITIGEKTASIQTQVQSLISSATHTFERLTIYKNRFHEDEALIQLNAEHIQLNAKTIIEHAEQIMLLAEEDSQVKLVLDGVNDQLVAMAGTITLQGEQIELKATTTYVDNLFAQAITVEDLKAEWLEVVDGATIAGLLSGEMIDAQSLVAASVNTEYLSADDISTDTFSTGSLSIGGTNFIPGNYVTFSDLTARLSNYATCAFVIDNYATSSSVATTLSGLYSDISSLESRVSALESKA